MRKLTDIENIGESDSELLVAVGIENQAELAKSDPSILLGELEQANSYLRLVDETPTRTE